VIVTGAGQGVGRATAQAFSAAGARVFAIDRDPDGLRTTLSGMGHGPDHVGEVYDLSETAGLAALVHRAHEALGVPWALVNVAATLRRQPLEEVTERDWDLQVGVNLKAGFFLAREAAKLMVHAGNGGRIVNFSSAGFLKGALAGSHVYVASKGGVVSMTRALARTYGPHAITVNTIVPGQIDTPMQHVDNPPEVVAGVTASCPLGRMGRPEEVAAVAVFLASTHAGFINGAAINVSGGSILY
jgi:NAD(P)-dependent dehydrogenase (short-subunit alcohol dehydrogenase family)